MSVIVSAGNASDVSVATERSGDDSGGQPLGIGATILSSPPRSGSVKAKCPIKLPARTPISNAGIVRFQGSQRMQASAVAMQVTSAVSEVLPRRDASDCRLAIIDKPRVCSIPSAGANWLFMMSTAAPTVNPTTTECGTISTNFPARIRPSKSWMTPTMKVSVSTSETYLADPSTASGTMRLIVISEIAFAGPVTINRLEPNSAAMRQGTMAEYRPYCGGMPASVAKATPCGNTTMAPVNPASTSARIAPGRRSSGSQRRMGKKDIGGSLSVSGEQPSNSNLCAIDLLVRILCRAPCPVSLWHQACSS